MKTFFVHAFLLPSHVSAALALLLVSLQMPLNDTLSTKAASKSRLSTCWTALSLVSLKANPELEHLAAPVARQELPSTAFKLLFSVSWCRSWRPRRQGQLPIFVATVVLSNGQHFHHKKQRVEPLTWPELAFLRRDLFFDEGFVFKRPWRHVDELQVIPSKLSAALFRMHLLPKPVTDSIPRASACKAHLDELRIAHFEDVKHHDVSRLI